MVTVSIVKLANTVGEHLYFGWLHIGEHFTFNGAEYKKVSALRAVNVTTDEKISVRKSEPVIVA